jgi:tryptophan halogenase
VFSFVSANDEAVEQDAQGYVTAVDTQEAGRVEGQLFVDCTGFRSLLLGDTMATSFKDVSDVLLTDTAMAVQVPYASEDADIACVTKATAQEAGWIWDIALQNHSGVRHVYSSTYMSDEDAERRLRAYCGDDRGELSVRKISMRVGYREKFWYKNCVAIGLSAAFVEPLEASAIFLVDAAGNMLSVLFPRSRKSMAHAEKKINNCFRFRWDKTIDFIKLHYYLSSRQDPFWQDNKRSESVPDSLLEKLDAWSAHPVSKTDFSDINEPFPRESYQYILHGMGFEQSLQSSSPTFAQVVEAKQYFANVAKATEHLCRDLPSHRSLIDKVCQYGFQKI